MTDEQRIARGHQYAQAKPLFDEVFDGLRQVLLEAIESAAPGDADHILEMHRGLSNLAKLRHAVTLVITDGLHAEGASNIARLHRA